MQLVIRADASQTIGTGHVMRCLALAQTWLQTCGQVTLLMGTSVPALEKRLQSEGIQITHLSAPLGSGEDAEKTIAQTKAMGANWVVIDGYHFGADYQRLIKAAGLQMLFIDDYGHAAHYWADLVLNQNFYAQKRLYTNREPFTQLLLGARYALLRKEFWLWRDWQRQIPTVARKVLITLGGADPDNVTLTVIQALQQVEVEGLEAVVVVGGSNPHYEKLQEAVQDLGIALTLDRNVTNMPKLMAWADVALSAGGTTSWELAFMGLPSLMLILADNQRAIAENLNEIRVAINLGWYEDVVIEQLARKIKQFLVSAKLRLEIANLSQKLVDGEGSDRVLMHLQGQQLRLRPVQEDDCSLLWQWANHPDVRRHSFLSDPIPYERHVEWFKAKLNSPDCQFYIAVNVDDIATGSIRFDIELDEAIVSINIDHQFRNQGYGSALIQAASQKLFCLSGVARIHAYIKMSNYASIRAFVKAGFQNIGTARIREQEAIHFVKQR